MSRAGPVGDWRCPTCSELNGIQIYRCRSCLELRPPDAEIVRHDEPEPNEPVAVYSYPGRTQADAAVAFAEHAIRLASLGYRPVAQSWADGRPGLARVFTLGLAAQALRPAGYLTVTYQRNELAPNLDTAAATKVCPDCAETVLAAARICRYCRHEFSG